MCEYRFKKTSRNVSFGGGFTLVEIIITISILAILSTIAYISMRGFTDTAQDSKRASDITMLSNSIDTFIQAHGSAPMPSNPKVITYSGANLWTQGIIDDSVTQSLGNVNNGIQDPVFHTFYSYSVLDTGKEFLIGGIVQTQEGSNQTYFPINNVYADDSKLAKPLAFLRGNYNGILARSRSGSFCDTIALPSILLSNLNQLELKSVASGSLVADLEGNIPASYSGTSVFSDGQVLFRAFTDPQVELIPTRTCDLDTYKDNISLENLTTNIGFAYQSTPMAAKQNSKYYDIAQTTATLSGNTAEKIDYAKKIMVNVLGEDLKPATSNAATGCALQPNIPSGTGYVTTGATQPDQTWTYWDGTGTQPSCSFGCTSGTTWNGTVCQNTRQYLCSLPPQGAVQSWNWTSGSGYTQRWSAIRNRWEPIDSITTYNTTVTPNTCYFECIPSYHASLDKQSCVKDCVMTSKTISGHSYQIPNLVGGTKKTVDSDPVNIPSACDGNNVTYQQDFFCDVDGNLTATGSEKTGSANCGLNYDSSTDINGNPICIPRTKQGSCDTYLPLYTISTAINSSTYAQTWDCNDWKPVDHLPMQYSDFPSICTYTCTDGYESNFLGNCVEKPCELPWYQNIDSGKSITAYATSSVPFGSICTSGTLTCNKGTLIPSAELSSGAYQNCTVDAALDCNGTTQYIGGHTYVVSPILHGNIISTTSAPIDVEYACAGNSITYNQSFACSNGTVTATGSESANSPVCAINYTASGSLCLPNIKTGNSCGTLPSNTYATTSTTYTQNYGCGIGWNPTYTWLHLASTCGFECNAGYNWNNANNTCVPNSCTLPWGGTLADSNSVVAYSSSNTLNWQTLSNSFTSNCIGTDACTNYSGTCSTPGQVVSCQTCNQNKNLSGGYDGYLKNLSCSYTCNAETRTCNLGSLSGTYTNPICSVPHVCLGTLPPSNATLCANDNVGLTTDTSLTQVATCTSGTKCEYTCTGGYTGTNCDIPPSPCAPTQTLVPDTLECKGVDGLYHGSCSTEGASCSYIARATDNISNPVYAFLDMIAFKYIDSINKTLVDQAQALCYITDPNYQPPICTAGTIQRCRPCSNGVLCNCNSCASACPYGYADPGFSCTCNPAPVPTGICTKIPQHCENKVTGACGDRATTFQGYELTWGTKTQYCATGSVISSPSAPLYPALGTSTTWTCGGLYGGNTISCIATRGTSLPNKCRCIFSLQDPLACPSGATWSCSDGSSGGCDGSSPTCTNTCVETCTAPNNVAWCTAADGSTKCFSGYPQGWSAPGDLGCKTMPSLYVSKCPECNLSCQKFDKGSNSCVDLCNNSTENPPCTVSGYRC